MKRFVFLVVFLLTIGIVSAEFNQEGAVKWLTSNIQCSRASIEEVAFATIALNSDECLNQLKINRIDPTGCFPKSNCNSKDTALAALALAVKGQPIDNQLRYLEESLKGASANPLEWMIQVVTTNSGTCEIIYGENDGGYEIKFVDGNLDNDKDGTIENGEGGSWIKFSELSPAFRFDEAVEEIGVDCRNVNDIQKVSVIKNVGNSFEIIEEKSSKIANFEIENGCYAVNKATNICSPDSTFYVSWVLKKLNKGLTTKNYLTSNANNDLYSAMLAHIDNTQLPNLIERQIKTGTNKGSFKSGSNPNVYTTSFAIDTIKDSIYEDEKNDAINWVEDQQVENSGKIGTGVLDTAVALYLIYSNVIYPGDGGNGGEGGELGGECITDFDCDGGECIDGVCQPLTQECVDNAVCTAEEYALGNCADCFGCMDGFCSPLENSISCPQDCPSEGQITCNNDGFCGVGENEVNCPRDCPPTDSEDQPVCGDGTCDFGEDNFTCPKDCESEKKSSLWWLWLIIIIIVLGGIIFFILTKLKKGGIERKGPPPYLQGPRIPPSPRYPPQYTAPIRRSPRSENLERDLDESIKQAQELLKKKK
jgi:hypothetical protein